MATEKALVKSAPTALATADPEKKLAQYRELGYNVVVAAMNLHVTDPRMMQDFKIIQVNPDPKMGEVFETGYNSGKFALQRPALERIAICAGITWDPRETKVLRAERDYALYQAVGYMRSESGETITLTGTKEIDMSVVEDEMRAEQTVKVFNAGNQNYKTWNRKVMYEELSPEMRAKVDGLTRREVTVYRKHKLARAETGAKLRAIRSMGLKSAYTGEELARPFVIVRVVPNPHDPMVRASMRQATLSLYGEGTTKAEQAEARAERQANDDEDGPEDAEFHETNGNDHEAPVAPGNGPSVPAPPDPPSDPAQGQNEAGTPGGAIQDPFLKACAEYKAVLGKDTYRAILRAKGYSDASKVPEGEAIREGILQDLLRAVNEQAAEDTK